jgi:thiol-disulfide isomerase/thioredoxin
MSSELDAFLQQYHDLVLVNFWEDNCEASRYMAQLLESIEQFQQVPMLRLALAEHRAWAHAHGIHGTPALVVYYRGQLLFRIIGRVTPTELLHRFQKLHAKEV